MSTVCDRAGHLAIRIFEGGESVDRDRRKGRSAPDTRCRRYLSHSPLLSDGQFVQCSGWPE